MKHKFTVLSGMILIATMGMGSLGLAYVNGEGVEKISRWQSHGFANLLNKGTQKPSTIGRGF